MLIKDKGSFTLSYGSTVGIALLFYKPEKRLSISIWNSKFSRNIRLFGPKKLSFEK